MERDRRKRTRIPIRFEVRIIVDGQDYHAQTENLSLKGILLTTEQLLTPEQLCQVVLTLSSEIVITIAGKIIRSDSEATAIDFISMDENSFFHLRRIVEYNAADVDQVDAELSRDAF
jgi:hypothetical protein